MLSAVQLSPTSRRTMRLFARRAVAFCLALSVGLPAPITRLRAQPANVPQLNTPQFSSADLQPYLDQANQSTDQAGWESVVASARTALAASWEAGIDAQINTAVAAVTEQDIFNSTSEYQDYVRSSLNIQKAEAFGQWELAMSAAIENGRSARLGAGTGVDLEEAERITASSLSDAERQRLEEITRTQKEWEERFLSEMQKNGAEFNAGMQGLLGEYNQILTEIAQKDQQFAQQKALIESYEQVVRNSIQGSIGGLEQLLANGAMFHAESCDAQNVCSVDMATLNAEGQSLQNLIDVMRNGLQTNAPLSTLVQQMGDYMRAQEENARLRAEYWQGEVYTPFRNTPPNNASPFVVGIPMPPGGPMGGNALWETEQWFLGNQNPLRQYLAAGSHKTAVNISGVDICGSTPANAMWSSFPLTLSISEAGDCRSGGADPYTYVAGSAIFWAGFALPVWQHFPEWQAHLHVTYRLHDANAEHNANVWNGYRNSLTPVANSWSGELLDAVSSWETQVAEFNAAHSAWQAEAAAQQAQAQTALAQGQLALSQMRDQWLQEQRRLYEDGKRRFDVLKDSARNGEAGGDLTNIAMPSPTAAPSAAEFAAIRNEFRSALPSAEERSLGDLSALKPDLNNLKKVAEGFQQSFSGIRNLAIAGALDSQNIQQQQKATAQLVSALEGVQIGIEGVSGFTVTEDESGRIVATRQVHSGEAVVRAGTEGTSASDYDAVMTSQTITLEKAAATKQVAGGDLFSRWDFNEYMADHQSNLQAAAEVRNDSFGFASEAIKSAQEEAADRYKAFMASAESQASARATIKAILESYVQSVLGGMSSSQAIGSAIQGQVRSMVAGAIAEATGLPASFIAAVLGGAKPHQAAMQWLEGEMWSTFETEMSKATGLPLNGVLSALWKQNEKKKAERSAKQEKMIKTGVMVVGAVAAPFTGGASLMVASAAIGAYDGYKAGGLQGAVVSAVGGVANYYVGAATGGAVSVGLSWDPENGFGGSVGIGMDGAGITLSASEHGGYGLSAGVGGDGFGVTANASWDKGGQFTGASLDVGYDDLDLDFGLDYSPGEGLTGSLDVGGFAEIDWSQNGGFTGTASLPFKDDNGNELGALTWDDENGFGGALNVADGTSIGWTQGGGFFGEIDLAEALGDGENDVGAPDLGPSGTLTFSEEGGFEGSLGLGGIELTAGDAGIGVAAEIDGVGTFGYDPEKGFTAALDIPDLEPAFDGDVGFSGAGEVGEFEISYGPGGLQYGFEAPDMEFGGVALSGVGYDSEKGVTGTIGDGVLTECDLATGECNSPLGQQIQNAVDEVADTINEIQQDIAQIGTDLGNMAEDIQNWNPIESAFGDEIAAIENLGDLQLGDLWNQDAFEEWALEEAEDFLDDYTGPMPTLVGIGGVIDPNNPGALPPGWDYPWGDDETPAGAEPEPTAGDEPEEGEEPEGEEPEVVERTVDLTVYNETNTGTSTAAEINDQFWGQGRLFAPGGVGGPNGERLKFAGGGSIERKPGQKGVTLVLRGDSKIELPDLTALRTLLDSGQQHPKDHSTIDSWLKDSISKTLTNNLDPRNLRIVDNNDWQSAWSILGSNAAAARPLNRSQRALLAAVGPANLTKLLKSSPPDIRIRNLPAVQMIMAHQLAGGVAGVTSLLPEGGRVDSVEDAVNLVGVLREIEKLTPASRRDEAVRAAFGTMKEGQFSRAWELLNGRAEGKALANSSYSMLESFEKRNIAMAVGRNAQYSESDVALLEQASAVYLPSDAPRPYVRERGELRLTIKEPADSFPPPFQSYATRKDAYGGAYRGRLIETIKPLPNGLIQRSRRVQVIDSRGAVIRDTGDFENVSYIDGFGGSVEPVFASGASREEVSKYYAKMDYLKAELASLNPLAENEIGSEQYMRALRNNTHLARKAGEKTGDYANRVTMEFRMLSEAMIFSDNKARMAHLASVSRLLATEGPMAHTIYNNCTNRDNPCPNPTGFDPEHGFPRMGNDKPAAWDCSRFVTQMLYAAGVSFDDPLVEGDTYNLNNQSAYHKKDGQEYGSPASPDAELNERNEILFRGIDGKFPSDMVVNGPVQFLRNERMFTRAPELANSAQMAVTPGQILVQRSALPRTGPDGETIWIPTTGHIVVALSGVKYDADMKRHYIDVAEAGGMTEDQLKDVCGGYSCVGVTKYYLPNASLIPLTLNESFNRAQLQ